MSDDALFPISSIEAARAFLHVCEGERISALKMQKLVYVAHFNHIFATSKPFISDSAEAWTDGPVYPELYRLIGNSGNQYANVKELEDIEIPCSEVLEYVKKIWTSLKNQSGLSLSNNAHAKNSPWYMALNPPRSIYQKIIGWKPKHPVIEDELIRSYFVKSGMWKLHCA